MAVRAHHYGVSFIIAAVVFGGLAIFAGESRGASAGSPRLTAVLAPASAQITVGKSASFVVYGVYDDGTGHTANVMPATISWLPVGGTVASYKGNSVVIKASAVPKTGNLGVDITYFGLAAHANAPLNIVAAPAPATPVPAPAPPTASPTPQPTPMPVLSTPAPLSSADIARLGALISIFRPATPTNSSPSVSLPVLGCIETNLGPTRFAAVSSGQSQPTADDRHAASVCFSGAEPVPAILAPVLPADVSNLSPDNVLSITEVKQVTGAGVSGATVSLLLSGKGAPDANIYLYLFSDPMIRRVQANSGGDWTYSLSAALPIGKHEIFAVAETADAILGRTQAYPVEIAAPVASNAGDAKSKSGFTTTQLVLAGVSALMLILGVVLLIGAARRRRRSPSLSSVGAAPIGVPSGTVMPTVSELIAAAPMAPPAPISVEQIVNTPIVRPSTGSTFLPGGTVPEEYREIPEPPPRVTDPPKS